MKHLTTVRERFEIEGLGCAVVPGISDAWPKDAPIQRGDSIELREGRRHLVAHPYSIRGDMRLQRSASGPKSPYFSARDQEGRRSSRKRDLEGGPVTPNRRPGVDAGWRVLFAFERPWSRATQAGFRNERSPARFEGASPGSLCRRDCICRWLCRDVGVSRMVDSALCGFRWVVGCSACQFGSLADRSFRRTGIGRWDSLCAELVSSSARDLSLSILREAAQTCWDRL